MAASPHYFLVLTLGNFRYGKVVLIADRRLMLLLIVLSTFFFDQRAHREGAFGDQGQFHRFRW